jgi:hypothetical protein
VFVLGVCVGLCRNSGWNASDWHGALEEASMINRRIVRKHALAAWRASKGDAAMLASSLRHTAHLAQEEANLPITAIIAIIQLIVWLYQLWAKHPPENDAYSEAQELEAMESVAINA